MANVLWNGPSPFGVAHSGPRKSPFRRFKARSLQRYDLVMSVAKGNSFDQPTAYLNILGNRRCLEHFLHTIGAITSAYLHFLSVKVA